MRILLLQFLLQYLASTHETHSGQNYLFTLVRQVEAIQFALDWKRRGLAPGGKKYKDQFAKSIYLARTGRYPPDSRHNSREDKQAFKSFKARQQNIITGRNYLLEMYKKVTFLLYTVTFQLANQCHLQFGVSVLLDPSWDINNMSRCTKTFRAVLSKLCTSRPAERGNEEVLKAVVGVLSGEQFSPYFAQLLQLNSQ